MGFTCALLMIWTSQLEGKNQKEHQKFDNIRKIRTLYSNIFESSSHAAGLRLTFRGTKGEVMGLSSCPTQSRFFARFSNGLLERMGRKVKSDLNLDHRILKIILRYLDHELHDAATRPERRMWVQVLGTYLVICFLCSLQGNEGFMCKLGGVIQHLNDGKGDNETHPHVVIPFLGSFKNESGERCHVMLAASENASGFNPRVWVEILLVILLTEGRTNGPVFADAGGQLISSADMNDGFTREIIKVRRMRLGLVTCDDEEVWELYNIVQPSRRGS